MLYEAKDTHIQESKHNNLELQNLQRQKHKLSKNIISNSELVKNINIPLSENESIQRNW